MKTALFDFVLDIATAFLSLIAQHLGKNPLESVITDGLGDGMVSIVTDIKGSTEEMARTVGGIRVMTL